jgi:hypothetical protein
MPARLLSGDIGRKGKGSVASLEPVGGRPYVCPSLAFEIRLRVLRAVLSERPSPREDSAYKLP